MVWTAPYQAHLTFKRPVGEGSFTPTVGLVVLFLHTPKLPS